MSKGFVTLSPTAVDTLRSFLRGEPDGAGVILHVLEDYSTDLSIGVLEGATVWQYDDIRIYVPTESLERAKGIRLDYRQHAQGFAVEHPHVPKVMELDARDLNDRIRDGEFPHIVDVRTAQERAIAHIDGSTLLDSEYMAELQSLEPGTPLVFV